MFWFTGFQLFWICYTTFECIFVFLLPNERLKSILLQVFEHYLLLLLLINLKVTFIIIVDFHENVVLIWTIYAQSNICFSFDHTHIRHVTLPSRRGMVVPSIFRLNLAFQLSSTSRVTYSLLPCSFYTHLPVHLVLVYFVLIITYVVLQSSASP